jgi:hypothetical protein
MPDWTRAVSAGNESERGDTRVDDAPTEFAYRVIHQWDNAGPVLGWILPAPRRAGWRALPPWRHCAAIARGLGYGGVDIGFLGASGHDDDGAAPRLCAIAHDRDLVVLAWGSSISSARTRSAVALLWRELASHDGSLAVLGWTPDGQPAAVDNAPKHPVLSCLCCAPAVAWDPLFEHDRRFDQLLAGVAA